MKSLFIYFFKWMMMGHKISMIFKFHWIYFNEWSNSFIFKHQYLQYAGHCILYNYLKSWWQILKICDYVVFQNSFGSTWAKHVLSPLILSNHSFYRWGICNLESKKDLPKVTGQDQAEPRIQPCSVWTCSWSLCYTSQH